MKTFFEIKQEFDESYRLALEKFPYLSKFRLRSLAYKMSEAIPPSKQQLITSLQALQDDKDYERAHCLADELILAYIGDKEVTEAFNKINKY